MGIYNTLEDKWYDFIDLVDGFIPVAGVIDSIDKVVPSFILFVLFLLLFLIGIGFLLVGGGGLKNIVSFEAELSVINLQGAPVSDAMVTVSINQECENLTDLTIRTNSQGKVVFKSCSESVQVRVTKEGYNSQNKTVIFKENKAKIQLAALTSTPRIVNVKVRGEQNKILSDAKLYLLCDKNGVIDSNLVGNGNQSSTGYLITIPEGCDSIQFKATANNYDEKRETLGLNEENKTINLTRTNSTGSVSFEVDSNSGKKDAIILVIDELGRQYNINLDSTGIVTKSYSSGEYTYLATLAGAQKQGSFSIQPNDTTLVEIFFEEVNNNYVESINNGTVKGLYLKIVDDTNAIWGAEARIYFKKNNDLNQLTKLSSNINGIVGHYPLIDTNERKYFAVISATGFETKIVEIEYKFDSNEPQEVRLSKGGVKLTVEVIDDEDKVIRGAVVSITKSDFSAILVEPKNTDSNGLVEFTNLPKGTYKIEAKTLTHVGSLESVYISSDRKVTLKIIVGTGGVKFNLINQGKQTNAFAQILERVTQDENKLIFETQTTGGYVQASSIKAEKEVFLSVPDKNYIYFESPLVKINRSIQTKNVVLYKPEDLPNSNKVQMFLEGVYNSNPWVGVESKANTLLPGKKYYFLFTLIVDNNFPLKTTTNFFVSPIDSNIIDSNTMMYLTNAYSVSDSILLKTDEMISSIIEQDLIDTIVSEKAKQINVYFGDVEGFVAKPILVEIEIDANASGKKTTLYWEGFTEEENSFLYSKEFIVGEKFCFGEGSCPEILFSNYYRRIDSQSSTNSEAWVPVELYSLMQVGEEYELKTIVENLTEKDFGEIDLESTINSNSTSNILFSGDKNVASTKINLKPFDKNEVISILTPISSAQAVIISEEIVRGDELKKINGNKSLIRFSVRNKEDVNIQVFAINSTTPNVLYSNTTYPMVFIKTFYKSNKLPAKTNWEVIVKGEGTQVRSGVTDTNGEWVGSLDLTDFDEETILIFTAFDENNSNPAYLEIKLKKEFEDPATKTIADCIKVKLNGVDIKTMEFPSMPIIYASVGASGGGFVVESTCEDEREVLIKSDLGVSTGSKFSLKPTESKTVTVSDPAPIVTQRGGMLGVYPLQVFQIVNKTEFNQIGFLDVIVSDPSSDFEIDNPIFDLRKTLSDSATIINKKNPTGERLDVYYPQLQLGTSSVGLSYDRSGVPETIKFNAVVKSHAIEALTHSYLYGSEIQQSNRKNKCRSKTTLLLPENLLFGQIAQSHTEGVITRLNDWVLEAPIIETPDANDRDPTKSFYDLPTPIQNKIRSELSSTRGTITLQEKIVGIEGEEDIRGKEEKLFFRSYNQTDLDDMAFDLYGEIYSDLSSSQRNNVVSELNKLDDDYFDYDDGTKGDPSKPKKDDVYGIMPNIAGSFSNSKCVGKESITCGSCSGETAGKYDSEVYDNTVFENEDDFEVDFEDEGTYSSNCSKCEINYNRVDVNPIPPKGFDGTEASLGIVRQNKSGREQSKSEDEENNPEDEIVIEGDYDEGKDAELVVLGKGNKINSVIEEVMVGEDNIWTKVTESVVGRLKVLRASGCHPCKVVYFGEWLGGLYTKGKKRSTLNKLSGGLWGSGGSTARLYVQDEYSHVQTYYNERVYTWEQELEFIPKEGTVIRLEPKYEYKIDSRWGNTNKIITDKIIKQYAKKNVLLEEMVVTSHGLIPFSIVPEYSVPDPENPLVEYRNNGLIYAEIPVDTVPPGVRLFLKGGYIYAEYIGENKALPGNEINFTLSKINLEGTEYAVLTVRDWINGQKVERIFQIKLMGNPSNCYSLDGLPGLTGKEFAPRLLFNWDWSAISFDQCESTNPNYTYCDATQFTVSMFKRLELIDRALISNDNKSLPKYSAFYAYLIKDGYSTDFLNDFDEYYSSTLLSSTGFNTTNDSDGFDKFITGNKIDYNLKSGENNIKLASAGGLPKGGLYRVEIETVLINPLVKSLFDQGEPNANINVTFTLIHQAQNYNLFYETPFDGLIGRKLVGSDYVFDRKGYGSSLNVGQFNLTTQGFDSVSLVKYNGTPLVLIDYERSNKLIDLMDQIVLNYRKQSEGNLVLSFNPTQPTPVVLRITNNNDSGGDGLNKVKAYYQMTGHDDTVKVDRSWELLSSTIGNRGKCNDFSGSESFSFVEQTNGKQKYFEWDKVTKKGTIELYTTFFTPPTFSDSSNTSNSLIVDLVPGYFETTNLLTVENSSIKNGTAITLNYFDDIGEENYKSLEGVFNLISQEKLCVSQASEEELRVWWNQKYLDLLKETTNYNKSNSCR